MAKRKLWSYNAGTKGISWVRVYERSQSARSLHVEWMWQGQRIQRTLKAITGHPITDKKLAMKIAMRMARELEDKHNAVGNLNVFGGNDASEARHTLKQLFTEYHRAKHASWSDHTRKACERHRDVWIKALGGGTPIESITPAEVEAVRLKGGAETRRKQLVHLRGAFSWAVKKKRWLRPDQDLFGLTMPTAQKSVGLGYSLEEVRALLLALKEESPAAEWMGHVAWQTGRRTSSILAVTPEDIELHSEFAVVTFRAEADKSGNTSTAVVTGRAFELCQELLDTTSDTICGVTAQTALRGWLWRAEKLAGVPRKAGRGWHSFKRAFATAAGDIGAASKQSGTRRETLTGIYEQDWVAPKIALAKKMADAATVTGRVKQQEGN